MCIRDSPSTAGAGDRRWSFRDGGRFGDSSNRLVSLLEAAVWHRRAHFPDGADPPSFREERLVRIAGRDALLHFGGALCRGGIEHFEDPVI